MSEIQLFEGSPRAKSLTTHGEPWVDHVYARTEVLQRHRYW